MQRVEIPDTITSDAEYTAFCSLLLGQFCGLMSKIRENTQVTRTTTLRAEDFAELLALEDDCLKLWGHAEREKHS